jgi:hypothetical protein
MIGPPFQMSSPVEELTYFPYLGSTFFETEPAGKSDPERRVR